MPSVIHCFVSLSAKWKLLGKHVSRCKPMPCKPFGDSNKLTPICKHSHCLRASFLLLSGDARCHRMKYTNHSAEECRVSECKPLTVPLFASTTFQLLSDGMGWLISDTDYTCPNPGIWPYIFVIQYLVLLKLILLTLLYALFRWGLSVNWLFFIYSSANSFSMLKDVGATFNGHW